jgi:hypothetical protein
VIIPALDGLTQAEFPGEIEEMARDYIAVTTETTIENVEVRRICAALDGPAVVRISNATGGRTKYWRSPRWGMCTDHPPR